MLCADAARLVGVGKIHHELASQVNAFAGEPAIGHIVQVAGRDQSSERHFAWRKGFPIAAAGVGSESYIGEARLEQVEQAHRHRRSHRTGELCATDAVPASGALDAGAGVATGRFSALGGASADATVMGVQLARVCSERPQPARVSLPAPEIRALFFALFAFGQRRRFRELLIAATTGGVWQVAQQALLVRCAPIHSAGAEGWPSRITINGEQVPTDFLDWKYRSRHLREYLADQRNAYEIGTIEIRDGKIILRSHTG